MKYPEKFIAKCRRVYPNWTQLHKCLEKGSISVSRMLSECKTTTFHYNEILRATSLEELQEQAQLMKDRCELVHDCDEAIRQYEEEKRNRQLEEQRARFNRERLGYL